MQEVDTDEVVGEAEALLTDPSDVAGRFQAAISEASKPDEPTIRKPGDGSCTLFVGLPDPETGELYKTASVRELRGSDEEALSKLSAGNGQMLYFAQVEDLILRRAVDTIGPLKPTAQQLGDLLIGDRGALFAQILITTYGETKEYEHIQCATCEAYNDFEIDIRGLMKYTDMKTEQPYSDVTLKSGKVVRVRYVTGLDQIQVLSTNIKATDAEMNTKMLGRCIVDETLPDKTSFARELGGGDRRRLISALLGNAPSVDFEEVKVPCPQCATEIPFVFGWADLLLP
jgi:hypothetical protein